MHPDPSGLRPVLLRLFPQVVDTSECKKAQEAPTERS